MNQTKKCKGVGCDRFCYWTGAVPERAEVEEERQAFEWPLVVYRDSFDRLFQYLENLDHYIDIGLIEAGDIAPIRYWLEQVRRNRFTRQPLFAKFIEHYRYEGVIALMKKFDIQL